MSKAEKLHPNLDWKSIWSFSILTGLDSDDNSVLFRMLHNLLSTQERLHNPLCTLCTKEVCSDQMHALVHCPFNNGLGFWLIRCLRQIIPQLQPVQLIKLDFGSQMSSHQVLPVIWLSAKTLQEIWMARVSKKNPTLTTTRAALEVHIILLRKTRHNTAAIYL